MNQTTHTAAIAALNDRFRREGPDSGIPGRWMLTQGIATLHPLKLVEIDRQVRAHPAFDEGDDPHGEHDFGAFDVAGVGKVFWKIDYYAPDMEHGSEDPADPARTVRVLTVMLASEY